MCLSVRRIFAVSLLSLIGVGSAASAQTTETLTYDELGRLKKIDRSSGGDIDYIFDDVGNRTSVALTVPMASLSIANASAIEAGAITFTVTRSVVLDTVVTVDYASTTGTAGSADFTAVSDTLTFIAGDPSESFTVTTAHDTLIEGNEEFTITLSNPSLGSEIASGGGTATGTIIDDETAPSFSVNSPDVSEGGTLVFTVTKDGATSQSHNVSYATANGSALAGSDYTSKSGTLTFAPTEISKNVSVSTIEDTAYESNETMSLNLSNPTGGATIATGQGTGTINNDDPNITYVRNAAGDIQPGFTEEESYVPQVPMTLYRTKDGTTVIHTAVDTDYCDTSFQPISGYSWTGNGCEMRVD